MSEQEPPQDRLDTEMIGHRSLRGWHAWLVTDSETGEDERYARTFSHYGNTSDECAWWAVAGELAFIEANGPDFDVAFGLVTYMELAVNDIPGLAELVREHSYAIPVELLNLLELDDD